MLTRLIHDELDDLMGQADVGCALKQLEQIWKALLVVADHVVEIITQLSLA